MSAIPRAQFPDIVPPQVQVTATYPGAGADVVEATVAQPIESQVIGVDNMLYMKSTSGNDGSYTLTVSLPGRHRPGHQHGQRAEPGQPGRRRKLPEEVTRQRRHGEEEILGDAAGDQPVFAEGQQDQVRHAVPEQLRDDQHPRRHQAGNRRRRRLPVRQPRIQHAHLGRERPADQPGDRTPNDIINALQCAEHPGGRRPYRRAADDRRPGLPAQHPDQGAA